MCDLTLTSLNGMDRWVRFAGLNNPLAVISYVAPVMAIATAILSLATEPLHKLAEEPFFNTYHNALVSSVLLLLGGSLAFFMVCLQKRSNANLSNAITFLSI